MPGYGYSGKPTTTGWDAPHIARAWVVLMKRLGYTQFVAQGGDWGAVVVDMMGVLAPPELIGIHTNMPGLSSRHRRRSCPAARRHPVYPTRKETGTRSCSSSTKGNGLRTRDGDPPTDVVRNCGFTRRPSAISYDHDACSYELIARVFDGYAEGLTRDDVLDNITVTLVDEYGVLRRPSLLGDIWANSGFSMSKASPSRLP